MSKVEVGSTVEVHYTGKLEDGSVFDSSEGKPPLSFKVGDGKIIPGFESGVVGMEQGQTKEIAVEPDEAYGERRDDLVKQFARDQLPDDIQPEVGQQLQMQRPDGAVFNVFISDVDE